MDAAKGLYKNLGIAIIFLYLAVFPLGQLGRLEIRTPAGDVGLLIVDILASFSVPLLFVFKKPKIFNPLVSFSLIALFTLILTLGKYTFSQTFFAVLYLWRFVAYSSLLVLVWNMVNSGFISRRLILRSLITVCFTIAVLGWLQYFWLPDLAFLANWEWDVHLYRLVGTFFDPSFMGFLMVGGAILVISNRNLSRRLRIALFLFFVLTIAFTYSRASYLSFIAAMAIFAIKRADYKKPLIIISIFLLGIVFLPRPKSVGVKLERTETIFMRFENYQQTLLIIKDNPVFGVGFNNLCAARVEMFGDNPSSHSCGGSDVSLLFVWATTGVVGLLIYLYLIYQINLSVSVSKYGELVQMSGGALLIHSLFSNTLFYAFVLGFMVFLIAISLNDEVMGKR